MIRLSGIRRTISVSEKLIFTYNKDNCKVVFNNEKNLNALDLDMIRQFKKEVQHWKQSKSFPKILILTSSPEAKAFCAGGDVKSIYNLKASKADPELLEEYFKEEYELDNLVSGIGQYGTVTIALWRGIVMGGGVGISINSAHRVACEDTLLAMPEAFIGLFTDVGLVRNFVQMDQGVARAMALAGLRVKGPEVYHSGLASRFIAKSRLTDLEEQLFNLSASSLTDLSSKVNSILAASEDVQGKEASKAAFEAKRSLYQKAFTGSTISEVISNFEQYAKDPLCQDLKRSIENSSPLSLKVIFGYMNQQHKGKSLADTYRSDFRLIKHYMRHDEFFIGVKNLLIEKSKERPKWTYASLQEVPETVVGDFLTRDIKSRNSLELD